jgi:hypothetical protein
MHLFDYAVIGFLITVHDLGGRILEIDIGVGLRRLRQISAFA